MKPVEQRTNKDCLAACCATLWGIDYDSIASVCYGLLGVDLETTGLRREDVDKLATFYFIDGGWETRAFDRDRPAILVVETNRPGKHHAVVWTGTEVFDPNINFFATKYNDHTVWGDLRTYWQRHHP